MNILISTDENYVFQTCVMLKSLYDVNSESDLVIFCFVEETGNYTFLENFLQSLDITYSIIKICKSDYEYIGVYKYKDSIERGVNSTYLTMSAFNRLLLLEKLPNDIERVLYLDSDIIVNRSLEPLYLSDIEAASLVVEGFAFKDEDYLILAKQNIEKTKPVLEYANNFRKSNGLNKGDKYFNSGVMLFNMKYLRNINFTQKVIEFVNNNEYKSDADQFVLNSILRNDVKYIPMVYNMRPDNYSPIYYKFIRENAFVIHYSTKPWNNPNVALGDLWYECAKTIEGYTYFIR